MKNIFRKTLISVVCLAAVTIAQGKEVTPGTMLNKDSIDSLLNDTLDGHTIKSMMTEKMEWLVRNQGFAMKLAKGKPIQIDPIVEEAAKRNIGKVTFDEKTRSPVGWKGGAPFPNIDMKDPHAGDKIAWNARYGGFEGYASEEPYVWVYLIDLDKGVERIQNWTFKRTHMNGRLGPKAGSLSTGDGTIFTKTLTYLTYPLDIAGIGVFNVRYMDPAKTDDKWVYINQFRRTKRVSGGGWMDPLGGGTDILVEDLNVWDGLPHWYPSVKLVQKRWMLAVANAANPTLDRTKPARSPEEAPYQDVKNAPYFNTLNSWEPREVYEIEISPPVEHPYGKRVVYMDTQMYQAFYSEIYDKKGEFYKVISYDRTPLVGKDGSKGYGMMQGRYIDLKRRHATLFSSELIINDPAINEKTIVLETLERAAGK
jgi:hypothetical protein